MNPKEEIAECVFGVSGWGEGWIKPDNEARICPAIAGPVRYKRTGLNTP